MPAPEACDLVVSTVTMNDHPRLRSPHAGIRDCFPNSLIDCRRRRGPVRVHVWDTPRATGRCPSR